MAKEITRIVLTGGPAAGKTTLISRILKEFKQEDGWRVIVIPETASDLISGFGFGPFENCMSMYEFQYFVFADQFHKERIALGAAQKVPQEKILIIYDRAIFDNRAYVSPEEFEVVLASFGKTREEVLAGYDAVIHLVSSSKGAEFAFGYDNPARYESIEEARRLDDLALQSWSVHPNVHVIDNSVDFEDKINRAISAIYGILGQPVPETKKRKYLIEMPDIALLEEKYKAVGVNMMQTYLAQTNPSAFRRIRQQQNGSRFLYFYTENRRLEDDSKVVIERPISEKEYIRYLMEGDPKLHTVRKTKYRFAPDGVSMAIDIYPFSEDRAVLFVYGDGEKPIPEDIKVIREITGDKEYKNRWLAYTQQL